MTIYRVKVTEKHTDHVHVNAESQEEAKSLAPALANCMYECLHDCEIVYDTEANPEISTTNS